MPVQRPMAMAVTAALFLLTACGSPSDAPGSVVPGEAQALNDAAEMLDANSIDVNAVPVDDANEAQPR